MIVFINISLSKRIYIWAGNWTTTTTTTRKTTKRVARLQRVSYIGKHVPVVGAMPDTLEVSNISRSLVGSAQLSSPPLSHSLLSTTRRVATIYWQCLVIARTWVSVLVSQSDLWVSHKSVCLPSRFPMQGKRETMTSIAIAMPLTTGLILLLLLPSTQLYD